MPLVSGIVESHKNPMMAAKIYVLIGVGGSSKNAVMAIDRPMYIADNK